MTDLAMSLSLSLSLSFSLYVFRTSTTIAVTHLLRNVVAVARAPKLSETEVRMDGRIAEARQDSEGDLGCQYSDHAI